MKSIGSAREPFRAYRLRFRLRLRLELFEPMLFIIYD
jgi:hypothetical protein